MGFRLGVLVAFVCVSGGAHAHAPDPNFYVFLCFGHSDMEGFPGVQQQDRKMDARFQVSAAVGLGSGRIREAPVIGDKRKQRQKQPAT